MNKGTIEVFKNASGEWVAQWYPNQEKGWTPPGEPEGPTDQRVRPTFQEAMVAIQEVIEGRHPEVQGTVNEHTGLRQIWDSVEGCGDHSCLVKPPKGMGTNGGCRCPVSYLQNPQDRIWGRRVLQLAGAVPKLLGWS